MSYSKPIYANTDLYSSQDLIQLQVDYMRRNSFIVTLCSLISIGVVVWSGEIPSAVLPVSLVAVVSLVIGFFLNESFLISSQRILVGLALLTVLYVTGISNSISTTILFVPILTFVFFIEQSKMIRWFYVATVLVVLLFISMKFWPGINLKGVPSALLAVESISNSLLASIFTGIFIRNHSSFSRLTIEVAKSHSLKLKKSLCRTKLAIQELEERRDFLSDVREKTFTALGNERTAAQKIKAGQEQLQQFAYAASHDLKEPVRTVRSFYQVIRRRVAPEVLAKAEVVQRIETVEDRASTMYTILERLLLFSRITSSKGERSVIDLSLFIEDMVSTRKEDFTIDIQVPASAKVYMERASLSRIFEELLSNAVHFSSSDRALELTLRVKDEGGTHLRCTLQDNGIGIPKNELGKAVNLFQRFSKTGASSGAGLGLSIVNEIVRRFDGKFSLTSEEGVGTTVLFELPAGGSRA